MHAIGLRASLPRLWPIILAIILVAGLRTALSLRGYLYLDDFAFRYWAATQPFGAEYLLQTYGGHVNPVGLAVQWVMQAVFPGSHMALALFSAVCFGVSLALVAAVLWRVTASVTAGVLGVVVAGLSLFTFEVTVWWAAAIYAATYQVFLLLSLYAGVVTLQKGSKVWAAVMVAAAAGAALSFSRGAVGVVLVFALVAALPLDGGRATGIVRTLGAAKGMWSAAALVAVSAALLVASKAGEITSPGFSVTQLPGYGWRLLAHNILPALWGGPWRWFELPHQQWPPVLANPAPAWWAVWLCLAASLVVGALIWRFRSELRLLLLVVMGYTLVVILLAGFARSGTLVASVAYRYTFDLVWPFTLLLVLAVVPASGLARRIWRPGVVLLAGTGVLAAFSTVVPARDWSQNPARQYVANAVSGFERIPEGQQVLDQGVPFDLIHPGFMAAYANARTVLTPQPGAPVFGAFAADRFFGFAPDGSLQDNDVVGPTSLAGPDPDCGYAVTDTPRIIPLDGELITWDFYARVAYFSGQDTNLNLAFGGQIHTVPLAAEGLRVVYLPVSGPGSEVLVSVGTPGVTACVTDIRIGNRVVAGTDDVVPLPVTQLPR